MIPAPNISPANTTTDSVTLPLFLESGDLSRADVLLFYRKGGFYPRLIRYFSSSHFHHAGLVFLVPKIDAGFKNSFIIESSTGGVDLTKLSDYTDNKDDSVSVVVKRFKAPWFTRSHQELVRGHMLNFIKADYDYSTIGKILYSVLARSIFGINLARYGWARSIALSEKSGRPLPGEFICSGLIQYGFFAAINDLVELGELPHTARREVLFSRELTSTEQPATERLLQVTPQNLADSEMLEWKYVIKNGRVYQVNNQEEALKRIGVI